MFLSLKFFIEVEFEIGRSFVCDGVFIYIINFQGKNLVKIGLGFYGIFR